jgi:hypothetical protein
MRGPGTTRRLTYRDGAGERYKPQTTATAPSSARYCVPLHHRHRRLLRTRAWPTPAALQHPPRPFAGVRDDGCGACALVLRRSARTIHSHLRRTWGLIRGPWHCSLVPLWSLACFVRSIASAVRRRHRGSWRRQPHAATLHAGEPPVPRERRLTSESAACEEGRASPGPRQAWTLCHQVASPVAASYLQPSNWTACRRVIRSGRTSHERRFRTDSGRGARRLWTRATHRRERFQARASPSSR